MPINLSPGNCCHDKYELPPASCLYAGDTDADKWRQLLATDVRVSNKPLPGIVRRSDGYTFRVKFDNNDVGTQR